MQDGAFIRVGAFIGINMVNKATGKRILVFMVITASTIMDDLSMIREMKNCEQCHIFVLSSDAIRCEGNSDTYSRTSMARTLMACLPRLFQTRS